MSAAKLYRVHVTQIRGGFTQATVEDCWIAAENRKEAVKRVREGLFISAPDERVLIHVSCYRGGFVRNAYRRLEAVA